MRASILQRTVTLVFLLAVQLVFASVSAADEVLDWNAIAVRAMQVNTAPMGSPSNAVPGFLQPRVLAYVHVAIFDALSGIDRRFEAVHYDVKAPRRVSRRAAVVGAAYTALVSFFPGQEAALTADKNASLAAIADDESDERIQRGFNWGAEVADAIFAWSETDRYNPPPATPYVGSDMVGKWRPTPPGFAPGAGFNLTIMRPFVIPSPSSFRSHDGPPPLSSREYAEDVNEVKRVGELTAASSDRTDDQTQSARFWAGAAASVWNRLAASAARRRDLTLSENAVLFAVLNMAATDALISCWDSKYFFELWRPITAIRLADTDGNSETVEKTDWTPLIVTPPYPEYDSGHQSISGSAQQILTAFFGKRMRVESYSEALGTGIIRSWRNFAAAADDAFMARIWAGIHFRFAMEDTRKRAEKIANYVLRNGIRPARP